MANMDESCEWQVLPAHYQIKNIIKWIEWVKKKKDHMTGK